MSASPAGAVTVHVCLAWRDRDHWDAYAKRPCRICHLPTNLRDAAGAAAHTRCIESAIEAKVADFARGLIAAETPSTRPIREVTS